MLVENGVVETSKLFKDLFSLKETLISIIVWIYKDLSLVEDREQDIILEIKVNQINSVSNKINKMLELLNNLTATFLNLKTLIKVWSLLFSIKMIKIHRVDKDLCPDSSIKGVTKDSYHKTSIISKTATFNLKV